MKYLVDTNVLSELIREKPDQNVTQWYQSIPSNHIFISVLTLGELRKGVEILPDSKRKQRLILWLEIDVIAYFKDNMLLIDKDIAEKWGYLQAHRKNPTPIIDTLLAATALHHDLILVTRNERNFQFPGLQVFNPFTNFSAAP
jgi:predicted nucleic acid-binding protein